MALFEHIIVGSGAAGTATALELKGKNVLVLDVGFTAPAVPESFNGDLFNLRKSGMDLFPHLVGEEFEALVNYFSEKKVSLKLKSPYMAFIIKRWKELSPILSDNFEGIISLAKGGLANAWGAGVFRYTDRDLTLFPIEAAELTPFYDRLTDHIGVSGTNDDLEPYFLRDDNLQEPIKLCLFAREFLERYKKAKSRFNAEGLFAGYTRLAVLTNKHGMRDEYKHEHMEFFKPNMPAIYTPTFTMDDLIKNNEVEYRGGLLVTHFREEPDKITVFTKNVETGEADSFETRKLFLGAGALNTARLVLKSAGDTHTRLPILDNPMSCIPLFRLDLIGHEFDQYDASVGQLNVVYDAEDEIGPVHIGVYGSNGPLRSDVLFDLPMPVTSAMSVLKQTAAATGLAMIFYPGKSHTKNYLKLDDNDQLDINYEKESLGHIEPKLIKMFRKIGYWSANFLTQYPPMGSSLHFAGMLPMKGDPGDFECDRDGRLFGTEGVFVVDGACFSSLPAKNLTFTIMANAMRIAAAASGT